MTAEPSNITEDREHSSETIVEFTDDLFSGKGYLSVYRTDDQLLAYTDTDTDTDTHTDTHVDTESETEGDDNDVLEPPGNHLFVLCKSIMCFHLNSTHIGTNRSVLFF